MIVEGMKGTLYIDEPRWTAKELWLEGWIRLGGLEKRTGCYIQTLSLMGFPKSRRQVEFSSPEKFREWDEADR